jgi:hypothetical protein
MSPSFVPDISKAKGAANDAINLFDSIPEIDAESPEGEKVEKCSGHIRFEGNEHCLHFLIGFADQSFLPLQTLTSGVSISICD